MRALLKIPKNLLIWIACAGLMVGALVVGIRIFVPVLFDAEPVAWKDIAGVKGDQKVELIPLDERSYMYDVNGNVMAILKAEQNRQIVTLDRISKWGQAAVISAEDKNFYEHRGFDLRAAVRALSVDFAAGSIEQGASTITQQVVNTGFFAGNRERKLRAKIQEAILAHRIEDQLAAAHGGDRMAAKRDLLTRYLNTIYLSNDAYGLEAGAETFFDKKAIDLTIAESALLAGVIKSPSALNPIAFPDAAKARRSEVLGRMHDDGVITGAQMDQAKAAPLVKAGAPFLKREKQIEGQGQYFAEQVKQVLLETDILGTNDTARYNALFKGGLKIYATYDPRLQNLATDAVNNTIPDEPPFTAALTVVESQTGAVRATVSGRNFNFEEKKYNLATQAERSMGSAFKVVALATALKLGYSPYDQVDGRSPCILGKFKNSDAETKRLNTFKNAEGGGGSILSLQGATVGSVNCAYMHLAEEIGPQNISDMAVEMGFGDASGLAPQEQDAGCHINGNVRTTSCETITLGAVNASTLDMASIMATIANGGTHHPAYFVEKIEDRNGKVIYQHDKAGTRVLDANLALAMQNILQGVVDFGTGTAAQLSGGRVAAGKTGTDDDFKNAAFAGFTKHYAAAVWMGDPDSNNSYMYNVGGVRVFGGTYPAEIWRAFMDPAHERFPVDDDYYQQADFSGFGSRRIGYFGPSPNASPGPTSSTTPPTPVVESTSPGAPPPPAPTLPPSVDPVPTLPVPVQPVPTVPVTTAPPDTSPPTTTSPPATVPPATAAPVTTAPPATDPPTTAAPTTKPPPPKGP